MISISLSGFDCNTVFVFCRSVHCRDRSGRSTPLYLHTRWETPRVCLCKRWNTHTHTYTCKTLSMSPEHYSLTLTYISPSQSKSDVSVCVCLCVYSTYCSLTVFDTHTHCTQRISSDVYREDFVRDWPSCHVIHSLLVEWRIVLYCSTDISTSLLNWLPDRYKLMGYFQNFSVHTHTHTDDTGCSPVEYIEQMV